MEKFKAVEKEMKTKAYSKEGLNAAAKLDPKEKEKLETCQFLSSMVEELERQIETLEAEEEALHANVKKGKKDTAKADRLAEIGRLTERHKWHQGKLELLLRSLENGNVETDQVNDLEESIRYYVEESQQVGFMEDDTIYDDLNLEEDEGVFGMNNDNDRVSSQDTQSIQDELPDTADGRGIGIGGGKAKSSSISEPPGAAARRPSTQLKSPLPALATLHTPLQNTTNGIATNSMKPAPLPTRAPGETLKYASAAAAAAASDKNGVGITPLPPPPGMAPSMGGASTGLAPLPPAPVPKSSAATSPSVVPSQPASVSHTPGQRAAVPVAASTEGSSSSQAQTKSPTPSHSSAAPIGSVASSVPPTPAVEKVESVPSQVSRSIQPTTTQISSERQENVVEPDGRSTQPRPNIPPEAAQTNGDLHTEPGPDESIYHLPPGLQDLIQSFEITKTRIASTPSPSVQRLLIASHATRPDSTDAEKPQHYKPQTRYTTPRYYPQEPLHLLDDQQLYGRIDTDTLFYIFYYRQGTYEQYLAAKSLKSQSWRFHKQYQTWFQRHEEPKTITEEFEQGTYRFFDYESTWSAPGTLLSNCQTVDLEWNGCTNIRGC